MIKLLANCNLFWNADFFIELSISFGPVQIDPVAFKVSSNGDLMLVASESVVFQT